MTKTAKQKLFIKILLLKNVIPRGTYTDIHTDMYKMIRSFYIALHLNILVQSIQSVFVL